MREPSHPRQVRAPYAFLSSFSTGQCRQCHLRRVGATGSIELCHGPCRAIIRPGLKNARCAASAKFKGMTGKDHDHKHPAQHAPAASHASSHASHHHAAHGSGRKRWGGLRRGVARFLRHRFLRRLFWATAISVALATVAVLGLWWRLSSGPIEFEMATPWLKAAIEDNFGGKHTVVVGGTQIERDEKGRTSLRLRDIVVRDGDGALVASAPKAEVGLSGMSLLMGQVRAYSLNLVGAEMAVRIEIDGRVTVFAGADKRPITTAAPALAPALPYQPPGTSSPHTALRSELEDLAGLMAWIDGVSATGFDGHDLREMGLKNGNLVVDDRRNGKQWTFNQINASLTRPSQGGVIFRLESDNSTRRWVVSAAMRPLADGIRAVGIEARNVSLRDILLAMRLNEGSIDADLPLSASIRADILPDGTPQVVQGQLVVDAGTIVDRDEEHSRVAIDHADFRFNWDARRRTLVVPFQIKSGGNQITMQATLEAPTDQTHWLLNISRGDPVIDPVILGSAGLSDDEGISINRVAVRARIDPVRKRIDLEQGDFSRIDTRPAHNVGVAVTGSLDYSGAEPHLAFGVAGTRMPMAVMKRMWPNFVAAAVRAWVEDHISGGIVERVVVAGNAPLQSFKNNGPPTPDDGLSVDIETIGTTLRPIDKLPAIRDADLTVRITGRTATINLGRGTVEVSGRKLNVASGVFEVSDTHLKPAPARAIFRIDGAMPAAAALLASDALRDNVGITIDPNASRGTIAAQVTVKVAIEKHMPKDAATYSIIADLTNFAADKMLLGQKVEASVLRVTASNDGYQVKGDVKINATPGTIDLHKQKGELGAGLRLNATIDEAARRRLGIDFGGTVTGSIPVKVTGRVGDDTPDPRMSVEADLTPVKIDNLLPGWVKAAGKPARATYTLTKTGKSVRFDDLSIDGPGVAVKGSVEIDAASEIVSANFPVFSLSDGDKVTLKADRSGDGVLRVVMRGDVYDGRSFVKGSLAGVQEKGKRKQTDLDLDIKIGTVAGYNGETLRGLDLRLSRRVGHIRSFAMKSKIGSDTPLNGDLRVRARDNHQVVYFETDDAGSLFRFTDMYPRMFGGQIWVAMDPPTQEESPQIGHVFIRSFSVRGEPALDRVVSGAPGVDKSGVEFSELRADFTRFPGKMAVRDGVVRGPVVGATIEGQIDYAKNDVHLRGTFVPFYGLNNMFGQIPILGEFLGGKNEGLLAITYEAVGPPGAPRISVNPVTAIAPGLLRKFIPSPGTFDRNFIPPTR
ncbi:MAG: hypothetical protein EXR03_02770 [Pseudolabrys sp.]|nr:hypothetical protein [Pseudolabrys sp.]